MSLGGYSHTWAWYGGSAVMTPFLGFSIRLSPYIIPQHNPIGPLFLQKKTLFLEILGPKVGLFFHQNVLFNRF